MNGFNNSIQFNSFRNWIWSQLNAVVNRITLKGLLTTSFILLCTLSTMAQSVLSHRMNGSEKGKTLRMVLTDLENSYPIHFYYLPDWIEGIKIEKSYEGFSLSYMLDELVKDTELTYIEWSAHSIVFVKDPEALIKTKEILTKATYEQKEIERIQLGSAVEGEQKKTARLKGKVISGKDSAPIAGATVSVSDLGIGELTNESGNFEISIPAGHHVLNVSYVGYEDKIIDLEIAGDAFLETSIFEISKLLDEVVVTDVAANRIATRKVGQLQISIKDVKRTPSFLGMTDIIKQVQTQTGVTTVSEASSGFNVRGGSVDQNLILFDGVPVFNTSHALGFFTAFNAEAIGNATFYKGGIPAEFGGRVSSVLDITTKEGGYDKWVGNGGIGLIASDLSLSGPIVKDTSSLTLSFRSSYSDWMLNLLKTKYKDIADGSVFFYDGSFKYSHKLNPKSKLSVSGYTSYDNFKLVNDTTNQWRNVTFAAKYDHAINNNFYYSVTASLGHYDYKVIEEDLGSAFQLNYGINYPSIKIDFTNEGKTHKIQYGMQSTYYQFSPGKLRPTSSESVIRTKEMQKETSLETAFFLSDGFKLGRLSIDGGIRLSMYNRFGPGVVYSYAEDQPREVRNTTDSTFYNRASIIKTYLRPEPRLSLQYLLNKQSSLKFGYNHMYQYLHLISNTATITPVDIWQSSNTYFKPQRADQVSIGYFLNSKNEKYEFSLEGFYKKVNNLLDFKDGASLILNDQLETGLLSGIGKSYGIETMLNKLTGKFTWSMNYTYSRSLRKVGGDEPINQGDWYPSNYDQPHILNINWRLELARKVFFTGFFTYHTGRPVSLPIGFYDVNNVPVTDFSERNNFRISDYNRLDIALIIEGNNKRKKVWESSWAFSFYNVYARKNPYSVYFADSGGGTLIPYQLSLIGTIVPSVTYRFKF
jgi:hypothetical protein